MKYKPGQMIKISRHITERSMTLTAEKLDPSYVATISGIIPDPHDGRDMYLFKECGGGWYECEVEGVYIPDIPIEDRFEILDL